MKRGKRIFMVLLAGLFWGTLVAPLAGAGTAESEYVDPARQAKWEAKQAKRAAKTEVRREKMDRWVGHLGKLKPRLRPTSEDSATGETVTNIEAGGIK